MSLKIKEIIDKGKNILKQNNIEDYNLDAELIFMAVTGFDRTNLLLCYDLEIEDEIEEEYFKLISKRAEGMPCQYIIGETEFMGLKFFVDPSVLIPRQDTEILVENALDIINKNGFKKVLDMATGSGCIAISLAKMSEAEVCATDIARDALWTARKNAEFNGVYDKMEFIKSDLFENIPKDESHLYDMIVSNPPYIKTDVIPTLMPEVKDYEPMKALDGGKDGLDFYSKITSQVSNYLKTNGYLLFEIGFDQGADVSEILRNNGFEDIKVIKDYAGLDRVVMGILKK